MEPGSHNDLYHRVMYNAVLERTERLHKEAVHAADVAEARRYQQSQPASRPLWQQKLGYTLISWGEKLSGEKRLVRQEVNS